MEGLKEIRQQLEQQRYIADDNLAVTLLIALKLGRPLLIEGAAGVGKTEVAKVAARDIIEEEKTRGGQLIMPMDGLMVGFVARELNGVLADHLALYIKTKNFHWHVAGPRFRDLHLLFDEQAAEILATTDLIAERIRKTGNTALRSIGDIARKQTIKDNEAEFVSAADMLAELRDDNLAFVQALRAAKELANVAGDNATDGMIDDWTDQAEQRAWFLFETSRNG